jgi:hypothetical protein
LWRSRFHADDRVVGRFIDLDGVAREVIAVMPASFQFPSARTDLWVPLGIDAASQSHYWAGDYMPVVAGFAREQRPRRRTRRLGSSRRASAQRFPGRCRPTGTATSR